MKNAVFAVKLLLILMFLPAAYGNTPLSYTSGEMRDDRREILYLKYCVEFDSFVRAKQAKNFDPTKNNQMIKNLVDLYGWILGKEYPPSAEKEHFIKGIMKNDTEYVATRWAEQDSGECHKQILGGEFSRKYLNIVNKYTKPAK